MNKDQKDAILLDQIGDTVKRMVDNMARTTDSITLTMDRVERTTDRLALMANHVGECPGPHVNPKAHYYASEYRSVSDPVRVRIG